MPKKPKRKLTAAQRRARRERKRKFMIIFLNGKQKRVPRPPTIDGLPVDEFIARNADPIWFHQNDLWEMMPDSCGSNVENPEAEIVDEPAPNAPASVTVADGADRQIAPQTAKAGRHT